MNQESIKNWVENIILYPIYQKLSESFHTPIDDIKKMTQNEFESQFGTFYNTIEQIQTPSLKPEPKRAQKKTSVVIKKIPEQVPPIVMKKPNIEEPIETTESTSVQELEPIKSSIIIPKARKKVPVKKAVIVHKQEPEVEPPIPDTQTTVTVVKKEDIPQTKSIVEVQSEPSRHETPKRKKKEPEVIIPLGLWYLKLLPTR